jgi:transcriptional regulator with XRE-family HTH domain
MSLYATKQLKKYRENKGYTQLEAAQLFSIEMEKEVALSTWQKWEQGTLAFTADTALMLARFFRVDLKDLVRRK